MGQAFGGFFGLGDRNPWHLLVASTCPRQHGFEV